MSDPRRLRSIAAGMPDEPGVYLMKDDTGATIYIGKATSLKKRVSSYFRERGKDPKTRALVAQVNDIEFIATESEIEALILESSLIRRHKPKFNIQKKDDKRYPYIAVTLEEEYPRVIFTRSIREGGSRYFGPYTDARAARKTVSLINALFKLKTCSRNIPLKKNERACMNYQIERCSGVCAGRVTREEYRAIIDQAVSFLEGRIEPVMAELTAMMKRFSQELDYEKASEIRDIIFDIQTISESQNVHFPIGGDQDFIGVSRRGDEAIVILFEFRRGVLLGRKIAVYDNAEYATPGEIISAFIIDYYRTQEAPQRLITGHDMPDEALVQEYCTGRSSRKVSIRRPETQTERAVMRLIQKNLDLIAAERDAAKKTGDTSAALEEIARILEMKAPPRIIECFDVSNIQGESAVASMVCFKDGKPATSEYRRYRIRGHHSANDPGMIHEVVARRVQYLTNENRPLPDLMIVDGGAGQLSRAIEAAKNFTDSLRIVSIAKRHEEIYVDPHQPPVRLKEGSPAFRLFTGIRDEAHRFAVSYHRKVRSRAAVSSELDGAPVGRKAAERLISRFKSVEAIRNATIDELTSIPGIGKRTAAELYEFFRKDKKTPAT